MRMIGSTWSRSVESSEGDSLPDEELVQLAQSDPDAFGILWQRYAGDIERFLRSRLAGDAQTAEDLTSVTFSKALQALPKYTKGPFRGWIYQIARNTLIDHQRRQRPAAPAETLDALPSHQPQPEEAAIRAEAAAKLHAALATLKGNQREIVKLRLIACTTDDICERLDMSVNAVKSAQFRAFTKLRESLGDVL